MKRKFITFVHHARKVFPNVADISALDQIWKYTYSMEVIRVRKMACHSPFRKQFKIKGGVSVKFKNFHAFVTKKFKFKYVNIYFFSLSLKSRWGVKGIFEFSLLFQTIKIEKDSFRSPSRFVWWIENNPKQISCNCIYPLKGQGHEIWFG